MSDPFDCPKCKAPIYVRQPTDMMRSQMLMACSCTHVTVYRVDTDKARATIAETWNSAAADLIDETHRGLWLDDARFHKATATLRAKLAG